MKPSTAIAAVLAAASTAYAAPEGLAARASTTATSITPVTVSGNAFFAGSSRFYVRGIDYQPGGSSKLVDPMADIASCARDIPVFQQLGVNTVRVYTVDNTANHDVCMNALAAAGIYLVLDVNSPLYSLNRANPAPSYNTQYLQNVFATIDAFAGYNNVLAFFSGNEVINDDTTTSAAPYVKAVTRDMRQYIKNRSYRTIPVGYSAADVAENRMEMAQFMNCGTDDERSDFFAFNDYSWCDPSSFTVSGWDQKVKNFTNYGLPIFLSEYGCITHTRNWEETAALYSTQMTAVYSGGLAYEYSVEENGYGMVTLDNATGVTIGPSYLTYQKALSNNPSPTGNGGYNAQAGSSQCPPQSSNWNVTSDALPSIPAGAKTFMTSGAGKGPGLTGPGSQDASGSGTSSGTAAPGSGSASVTASSASATSTKSAAVAPRPFDQTPFAVGMIVLASTFMGGLLL